MGVLLIPALNFLALSQKANKVIDTRNQLKVVYNALSSYYKTNNELPCPANITLDITHNNAGKEDCTLNYDIDSSSGDNDILYGAVPVDDIGLSFKYITDAWGNKLSYYIRENATTGTMTGTTDMYTHNKNISRDDGGTVFVLISHGEDARGSYPKTGGNDPNSTAGATADELKNIYDVGTSKDILTSSRLIISDGGIGDISISSTGSDVINEMLGRNEQGDYFAGSLHVENTGNVGIGITNPTSKLHVSGNLTVGGDGYALYFSPGSTKDIVWEAADHLQFVQDDDTERMRIDKNGRLMLNTTDNTDYIDNGANQINRVTITETSNNTGFNTTYPALTLRNEGTTDSNWSILGFATKESSGSQNTVLGASIAARFVEHAANWAGTELWFFTTPNSGPPTARMTIDRDGDVTINEKLCLNGVCKDEWSAVPPGAIFWFATNTAPSGYLICNGTGYSTSTYPDLFDVIGYNYGGSGSTFYLPNLVASNRFIRADSSSIGSTESNSNASHNHNFDDYYYYDGGYDPNYATPAGDDIGIRAYTTHGTWYSGGSEARPNNMRLLPIIKY